MNFCSLSLDGKELETSWLKWNNRTKDSSDFCQVKTESKQMGLAGIILCRKAGPAEKLISCSVFKEQHGDHIFCFIKLAETLLLLCAFGTDSKGCVTAEENLTPSVCEGCRAPATHPGQSQEGFGSESEHLKVTEGAG